MSKSMWAISLPSPTNASPMNIDITRSPVRSPRGYRVDGDDYMRRGGLRQKGKKRKGAPREDFPLGAPLTPDTIGITKERFGSERATREGRPVGVTAATVPGVASLVFRSS